MKTHLPSPRKLIFAVFLCVLFVLSLPQAGASLPIPSFQVHAQARKGFLDRILNPIRRFFARQPEIGPSPPETEPQAGEQIDEVVTGEACSDPSLRNLSPSEFETLRLLSIGELEFVGFPSEIAVTGEEVELEGLLKFNEKEHAYSTNIRLWVTENGKQTEGDFIEPNFIKGPLYDGETFPVIVHLKGLSRTVTLRADDPRCPRGSWTINLVEGPKIEVRKYIDNQYPKAGWHIATTITNGNINPTNGETTKEDPPLTFKVAFDNINEIAEVALTETVEPGYKFESAECKYQNNTIVEGSNSQITIPVAPKNFNHKVIDCKFYNTRKLTTINVEKYVGHQPEVGWRIDSGVADGDINLTSGKTPVTFTVTPDIDTPESTLATLTEDLAAKPGYEVETGVCHYQNKDGSQGDKTGSLVTSSGNPRITGIEIFDDPDLDHQIINCWFNNRRKTEIRVKKYVDGGMNPKQGWYITPTIINGAIKPPHPQLTASSPTEPLTYQVYPDPGKTASVALTETLKRDYYEFDRAECVYQNGDWLNTSSINNGIEIRVPHNDTASGHEIINCVFYNNTVPSHISNFRLSFDYKDCVASGPPPSYPTAEKRCYTLALPPQDFQGYSDGGEWIPGDQACRFPPEWNFFNDLHDVEFKSVSPCYQIEKRCYTEPQGYSDGGEWIPGDQACSFPPEWNFFNDLHSARGVEVKIVCPAEVCNARDDNGNCTAGDPSIGEPHLCDCIQNPGDSHYPAGAPDDIKEPHKVRCDEGVDESWKYTLHNVKPTLSSFVNPAPDEITGDLRTLSGLTIPTNSETYSIEVNWSDIWGLTQRNCNAQDENNPNNSPFCHVFNIGFDVDLELYGRKLSVQLMNPESPGWVDIGGCKQLINTYYCDLSNALLTGDIPDLHQDQVKLRFIFESANCENTQDGICPDDVICGEECTVVNDGDCCCRYGFNSRNKASCSNIPCIGCDGFDAEIGDPDYDPLYDLDNNGIVDLEDFRLCANNCGGKICNRPFSPFSSASSMTSLLFQKGDANDDGRVDNQDYLVWLGSGGNDLDYVEWWKNYGKETK